MRYGHSGLYDSARDRFVIFGGYAGGGSNRNDTWSLDLRTLVWSQVATTGGPPSARQCFASSWDQSNNRFIVSGGWGSSGDTWFLDLNTFGWSRAAPAPNVFYKVGIAFDNVTGRMIVVDGEHGIPADSMALVFDVRSNTWFDVNVTGVAPPPRGPQVPSAIFDPVGQRAIMFGGGGTSLSVTFNDTSELLLSGHGPCLGGADLDGDGDVDLVDFAGFQRIFGGP